jgi:hypothetical protein
MDSVTVMRKRIVFNPCGLIFIIQQDSFRFDPFKKLALYDEDNNYHGTYRVVNRTKFRLKSLSRMMSLLLFSCHEGEGLKILREMKIVGKKSDEVMMCLICLEKFEFNENHVIPKKSESKPEPRDPIQLPVTPEV